MFREEPDLPNHIESSLYIFFWKKGIREEKKIELSMFLYIHVNV